MTTSSGSDRKAETLRMLGSVIIWIGFLAVWFIAAGRWDWIQGWLLLIAFIVLTAFLSIRMRSSDPELLRERNRPGSNVEGWDKIIIRVYIVLTLVMLFVAALDSGRFGWSYVPVWIQLLGWSLLIIGALMISHVMQVNPFLSSWARIQDDRGQYVISSGLYGIIRHPMYAGIMLVFLALPIILASWWALIPSVLIVAVFFVRTIEEDKMLREGLDGYEDYARKVPYRLVPGVF